MKVALRLQICGAWEEDLGVKDREEKMVLVKFIAIKRYQYLIIVQFDQYLIIGDAFRKVTVH